jgi:hypothetical protein
MALNGKTRCRSLEGLALIWAIIYLPYRIVRV